MMARDLTVGERKVLELIQSYYGPQNTPDHISWVNDEEAVIWVTAPDGSTAIMANLSNLATWRANGIIKSDEELKNWLQIRDA